MKLAEISRLNTIPRIVTASSLLGLTPLGLHRLVEWHSLHSSSPLIGSLALTLLTAPYLASGTLDVLSKRRKGNGKSRIFHIGGMECDEEHLFTNIIIPGSTGSGKTSAVLLPFIEEIINTYNEEALGYYDQNPYQKCGGLAVDVKGQFYEFLVTYLYRTGRNVVNDLTILTPVCDYPVVEMVDPGTGRLFYLNGRNCSSGSEASLLLKDKRLPNEDPFPSDYFEWDARRRATLEKYIKDYEFTDLEDVYFCGWRREYGSLVRVSHTPKAGEVAYILKGGKRICIDPPKQLKYKRVIYVNNGVRLNLLNPILPSAEVANRQSVVAAIANGRNNGNGENQYFYDQASILMGWAIDMWRELHPETECTVVELMRLVTQQQFLATKLKSLQALITKLTQEIANKPKEEIVSHERRIQKLKDIGAYFQDTWGTRDAKNKGLITSVVETAFKAFLADSALQEVFCRPSTFTWEDVIQKGKIVVLHAGPSYETLGKLIGTGAKLDYQSAILSRIQLAHLNKMRIMFYLADEGHNYATAGGSSGGDDRFQSLSREARCFNAIATQGFSSILQALGEGNSKVYLQQFGIICCLQTMDTKDTAERISNLLGDVEREKIDTSGNRMSWEQLFIGKTNLNTSTKVNKEAWFSTESFTFLDKFESITFNKCQQGKYNKVLRHLNQPTWITGPDGKRQVAQYMRRYFQESIEQFLWRDDKSHILDHDYAPPDNTPKGPIPSTSLAPAAPTPEIPASSTAPISPVVSTPDPVTPTATPGTPSVVPAAITPPPVLTVRPVVQPEADLTPPPSTPQLNSKVIADIEKLYGGPAGIAARLEHAFAELGENEPIQDLLDPTNYLNNAEQQERKSRELSHEPIPPAIAATGIVGKKGFLQTGPNDAPILQVPIETTAGKAKTRKVKKETNAQAVHTAQRNSDGVFSEEVPISPDLRQTLFDLKTQLDQKK